MISRKKKLVLLALVATVVTVAISLLAYPTFAAGPGLPERQVTVEVKGRVLQRIDDETIKIYPVNATLTLELGKKRLQFVRVLNVSGIITINDVTYTVLGGRGWISARRHGILLNCRAVDTSGDEIAFRLIGIVTRVQ